MHSPSFRLRAHAASALVAFVCTAAVPALAQERPSDIRPPDGLRHDRGELVSPVFEGWYRDAAGVLHLSFGYFNRNFRQELDVPIGPDGFASHATS